ncbi:MAG: replication protein [Candidatus Gracilibacteria bacterium]|nr:replication protein [Candidatus Gracilibacteria bacterium]
MKMKKEQFTKIPNKILVEMARSLSFCEKTRIFCAILRKTAGWNKKEDWIALSQFEDLTGMAKPNVCRALKKLLKEKIIIKMDNKYRINDITARWQALSKRTPFIKTDKGDYQNGKSVLSKPIPTKETITKDIYLQKTRGKGQIQFDPYSSKNEKMEDLMTLNNFLDFWELYPRKKQSDRLKTMRLFIKLPQSYFPKIMNALEEFIDSDNWNKADGIFIPHPSNWIRDCKWEDDPEEF